MESLGTLSGGSWSTASDVSADGTIVVGTSGSSAGDRAFIWRANGNGGTAEDLANLQGSITTLAQDNGQAVSVQQDIVVHLIEAPVTPILQPVQVVGPLLVTPAGADPSASYVTSVRIVGDDFNRSEENLRFLHSIEATNQRRDELNAALPALSEAVQPARPGAPPGAREALAKAQKTVDDATRALADAVSAERRNRASISDEDANSVMEYAKGQNLRFSSSNHGRVDFSNRGASFLTLRSSLGRTAADSAQTGAVSTAVAGFSYGRGVTDRLTLGLSADLQRQSLHDNAFDMKTSATLGLWAHYSATAGAGTGLQVSGGVGYTRADGTVTRGRLLADVVEAQGDSTLTTRAARLSVGYGVMAGKALRLTPAVELAHFETRRDAYTERGAAFNASYDAEQTGRTTLSLALRGEQGLGARDTLTFGVGIEHDLHVDAARMTGTSDLPGFETFDIQSPENRNRNRPSASLGYVHRADSGQSFSVDTAVSKADVGSKLNVALNVAYHWAF
jgi:hypothetical protein